ncbi:MAG: hypothetical protein VX990_01440 [Pseudomonadota bacterium]|nr:hypothetical protein [Pseudomonadota bacterium]
MPNRIAVVRDGELQQFASPTKVHRRAVNAFVAGFIGTPSKKFTDGELAKESNMVAFRAAKIHVFDWETGEQLNADGEPSEEAIS